MQNVMLYFILKSIVITVAFSNMHAGECYTTLPNTPSTRILQRTDTPNKETHNILTIVTEYSADPLPVTEDEPETQYLARQIMILGTIVGSVGGLMSVIACIPSKKMLACVFRPQQPLCPISLQENCSASSQLTAHLIFGDMAVLTTSSYLFATSYMVYKCGNRTRKYATRTLHEVLLPQIHSSLYKIGNSAQWFGRICCAMGMPLLPMGISWATGEYAGALAAEQLCQTPPAKIDPVISFQTSASSYMFLTGSLLTTIGTASWLLGKKLTKIAQTRTQQSTMNNYASME